METPESGDPLETRAVLLLFLVLAGKSLASTLHRRGIHFLPESAVYMAIGCFAAAGMRWGGHDAAVKMSSRFFYMALLPPIVFEGGYSLQRLLFFNNFAVIFALAFVGGLYSTVVTSLVVYLLGRLVVPALTLQACLVFGALISSTDPVTVLALLPDNLDKRLYMIIFGESALNDAVAVILFRFFSTLDTPSLSPSSFLLSILASGGVFLGSTLVGLLLALGYALATKHAKGGDAVTFQSVSFLAFAYASYLLAESLHLTGIISVFFCGLGMAHYGTDNVDEITLISSKVMLRTFSTLSEGVVFTYLGMGVVAWGGGMYDLRVAGVALAAILLSRTHVFIICSLSSLIAPTNPIPFKHQVLIWFSGLRGAVAFALSVTILESTAFTLPIRELLFGTGVLIIVFTILVLGGLTPLVLSALDLTTPDTLPTHAAESGSLETLPNWLKPLLNVDRRLRPLVSNPPRRLVILPDPDAQRPHDLVYTAPQSTVDLHPPSVDPPSKRDSLRSLKKEEGFDEIALSLRSNPVSSLPPIASRNNLGSGSLGSIRGSRASGSLTSLVLRSTSSLHGGRMEPQLPPLPVLPINPK